MDRIKIKKKNVIDGDVSPKLKIIFKMSHNPHKELSLTQIADMTGMPKQLVSYHIPELVECGVVIKNDGKFTLQDHFYHVGQYMELLMPLIRAIDKSIKGSYDNSEMVLLSNVAYFLANVSIEIDDDCEKKC